MASKEANADGSGGNCVEEPSITMLDVLEQEQELEEEYAAVLGASDEKCCTYTKGPIKRQALYSCLTCCPEARVNLEKCAGICLACSYKCHENHELIELYTKRNFRCDCPTARMGSSNRCLLNTELGSGVQPLNSENLYNQNFQGIYCICHRPYPDPESTSEELMLQCAVCEDWLHMQHLDVPASYSKLMDSYNEMICGSCMQQHPFLQDYTGLALKALETLEDESSANITVTGLDASMCDDDNKLKSDLDKSISEIMNIGNEGEVTTNVDKKTAETSPKKVSQSESDDAKARENVDEEPDAKRRKLTESTEEASSSKEEQNCRRPKGKHDYEKGATFWGNDWRAALCQCGACMEIYKASKLEFLLDAEDSAKTYEERGIKRAATESSSYEQGIRALASIGRVQQIDAITEYNRMKDKLKDFLQTFAISKKVVTQEDINRFFEQMRNEKNANLGQPFFCR